MVMMKEEKEKRTGSGRVAESFMKWAMGLMTELGKEIHEGVSDKEANQELDRIMCAVMGEENYVRMRMTIMLRGAHKAEKKGGLDCQIKRLKGGE